MEGVEDPERHSISRRLLILASTDHRIATCNAMVKTKPFTIKTTYSDLVKLTIMRIGRIIYIHLERKLERYHG